MDTKTHIIRTFYQLVSEKGYANATINEVCKRANISKGSIYHYFKSKEELLYAVLNFVFSKDQIIIFNMDNLKSSNYKDKLIEMGKNYLNLNKSDKHYTQFRNEFIVLSLRDEKIKDYMVKLFYEYMDLFRSLLEKLKNEKLIKDTYDIETKAIQLFMILDSVILYQSFNMDLDYEAVWVDFIEDIFK